MTAAKFSWVREGVGEGRVADCELAAKGQAVVVAKAIKGGDFANVGAGAGEIKKLIKKLPIAPRTVRRAAIACFEAEANVIVYAREGSISAVISPKCIYVVVEDRGPGILDIERAMEPGFTTATADVREMGFGAGLGLPNIRQNVDFLEIETEVGVGTALRFGIFLDDAV